jgi:hypothetical protein
MKLTQIIAFGLRFASSERVGFFERSREDISHEWSFYYCHRCTDFFFYEINTDYYVRITLRCIRTGGASSSEDEKILATDGHFIIAADADKIMLPQIKIISHRCTDYLFYEINTDYYVRITLRCIRTGGLLRAKSRRY